MAYDFPIAPTVGQKANGYVWDGEKWVSTSGGGIVSLTDTDARYPRYDGAQTLTAGQQTQARANIGVVQVAFDTVWKPMAYQNGWLDYGSPFGPCGYRKLPSGLVILKGICQGGTAPLICNLPAGYRPGYQCLLSVQTSPNAVCRLDISTSGDVSHTGGNSGWLSFNSTVFLAEN
jgi:hypothetical protein